MVQDHESEINVNRLSHQIFGLCFMECLRRKKGIRTNFADDLVTVRQSYLGFISYSPDGGE